MGLAGAGCTPVHPVVDTSMDTELQLRFIEPVIDDSNDRDNDGDDNDGNCHQEYQHCICTVSTKSSQHLTTSGTINIGTTRSPAAAEIADRTAYSTLITRQLNYTVPVVATLTEWSRRQENVQ